MPEQPRAKIYVGIEDDGRPFAELRDHNSFICSMYSKTLFENSQLSHLIDSLYDYMKSKGLTEFTITNGRIHSPDSESEQEFPKTPIDETMVSRLKSELTEKLSQEQKCQLT